MANYLIDGPAGPVIQPAASPSNEAHPLDVPRDYGTLGPANKPAYNRTQRFGLDGLVDDRFGSKADASTVRPPRLP